VRTLIAELDGLEAGIAAALGVPAQVAEQRGGLRAAA